MISTRPEGETLVGVATTAFTDYQAGHREALDLLVDTVTPLLWRTVREIGLDRATSEDVIQNVWLSLLRKADTILEPRTIVKWLLVCARREAWRASKRIGRESARSGGVLGVDHEELLDVPEQREALPDETVLRDVRQRQLWHHVQALPARCRQLISVIAFADRPDYAHIAESLGMPVGSIGPTRGRCLARLRDLLAGDTQWEGELS